jgi:hypothetical protein
MASLDPSKIFRDKGGTTYYDMEVPIQTSGFRGGSAVPPAEMPTGAGSVPPSQMPNVSESAVPPAEMATVEVSHAAISAGLNGPQKAEAATEPPVTANITKPRFVNADAELKASEDFESVLLEYNNSKSEYQKAARKYTVAKEGGGLAKDLAPLYDQMEQAKSRWDKSKDNIGKLKSDRANVTFSSIGRQIMDADNKYMEVTETITQLRGEIDSLSLEEKRLGEKTDEESVKELIKVQKQKSEKEKQLKDNVSKSQSYGANRRELKGDVHFQRKDAENEIKQIDQEIASFGTDDLVITRDRRNKLNNKKQAAEQKLARLKERKTAHEVFAPQDAADINYNATKEEERQKAQLAAQEESRIKAEQQKETPKALNDATIDRLFKVSASLTSQSDVTDSISKPFSSAYESAVNSFDRDSAEKKLREQHELDKKQGKKALVGEGWFAQEANLQAHESGMQAVVDAGKDIGLTQKDAIQSFKKERGEITGKPDPRKQAESAEVKLSQHQNDEMKKNGIRSASGKEGRAEKPKMSGFNDGSAKLEGKGGESHFDDGPTRLENKGGKSELGGPRKAHSRGGDRLEDYKWKPLKRADPFGYRISEAASGAEKAEKESQRSNKWNASAPDTKRQLSEIYGMEDGGGGVGGKAIIRIELAKGLDVATGSNDQVKGAVLEIIRSAS